MLKSKHTFVLAADDKTKGSFDAVAKRINGVLRLALLLVSVMSL